MARKGCPDKVPQLLESIGIIPGVKLDQGFSDMPGSMYGFAGEERHFAARGGDRIVTWTGPAAFDMTDPGLADAELWTWNGKDWERQPIPRPNG